MDKRIALAAYLAHVRRADGSWVADWTVARLAIALVRQVLRQHLTNPVLSYKLAEAIYAASEDLRTQPDFMDWTQVQGLLVRVVPVTQALLRTLARQQA